ncbi:diguanylate phosphodiesterase [Methylobacterium sp. Leaf123]|uniref:putative bifunctional diguanylate cyclase/phosphodiesterase n=1 Tax=Methylobacterium sp. Leaf123 TaxID=1736264 RepID=UPI0006FF66A5|nr:EAL domain-containing protein [Methylobacterium sp. Leaf123]KQQ12018.1 diguanylate phosphodiesterase [Methylobacterium sp. Leaf123]
MRSEPAVSSQRLHREEAGPRIDPVKRSAVVGLTAQRPAPEGSAIGSAGVPQVPARIGDLKAAHLRSALAGAEFSLAYQPIVSAATGAITSCEALLRWQHPSLGPVSPADFIPLAEETGAIGPIGAWVLETACRQAADWPEFCRVSVNVSPVQLQDPGFTDRVAAALRVSGLAACRLELELTEGVPMGDVAVALEGVAAIRTLGVSIALDDFGTGFSSLGYLQHFAFDRLKIDRTFIRSLGEARESWFLVRTMHDIAHHFGMAVTAEGIETEDEARMLREIGATELQGFLFSRPVAGEAAASLLKDQAHRLRSGKVGRRTKFLNPVAP